MENLKSVFLLLEREGVKCETLQGFNWQPSVGATSIFGLAVMEFSLMLPGTSNI